MYILGTRSDTYWVGDNGIQIANQYFMYTNLFYFSIRRAQDFLVIILCRISITVLAIDDV